MERGSAHHGPRVDDELAAESAALLHGAVVSGRDREDLEPEAPTAEEQLPVPAPGGPDADGVGPTHADVIARSELARWLLPSAFPATSAELATVARENEAPEAVVDALDGFRSPRRFETVGELWTALGGAPEHRPVAASAAVTAAPAPAGAAGAEPPIVRLITLGPRLALATVRTVGRLLRRGVSAITHVPPS
jgi:hypothetical protein